MHDDDSADSDPTQAIDARVDVGGATLACLVAGDGPLVLAAHGFPDCARRSAADAGLVAAGFRVVAPYLRGYAPSTPARDGRYDAAALGSDLVALARHFSPGAPVRLVGHDWGAIAAYAAVALAPGAFSHPPPSPCRTSAWPARASPRRRSCVGAGTWACSSSPASPSAARRRRLRLRRWLMARLVAVVRSPADEMNAVKASLRGREHEALAYYRAIFSRAAPSTARLLRQRTRVPSLYVHGVEDGCVGVALADGVERAYAGPIAVHRLAGGHFVHQQAVEQFNAILVEFLDTEFPS